jgi:hypothetical protein
MQLDCNKLPKREVLPVEVLNEKRFDMNEVLL